MKELIKTLLKHFYLIDICLNVELNVLFDRLTVRNKYIHFEDINVIFFFNIEGTVKEEHLGER